MYINEYVYIIYFNISVCRGAPNSWRGTCLFFLKIKWQILPYFFTYVFFFFFFALMWAKNVDFKNVFFPWSSGGSLYIVSSWWDHTRHQWLILKLWWVFLKDNRLMPALEVFQKSPAKGFKSVAEERGFETQLQKENSNRITHSLQNQKVSVL